jgi:hypothetical protein
MPEATVNEDDHPSWSEDDIGTAGKILAMQSEAIAETMQQATNQQLRLSVSPFDTRHSLAALRRSQRVHASL